ncbi:MAG: hypothetical protein JHC33_05995 [Ignisphaera sp.]|nr:hypothetical protein [Ignisphaera sp.]
MKILIEGVSILSLDERRPFIKKGYIYIDRGITVAYNEGEPPPELEFAEYVVNENFAVAIPGFTVGMGNILEYLFRFTQKNEQELMQRISSLTKLETEALIEVSLASLNQNGVTSIISFIPEPLEKLLSAVASAVSDAWTRFRIVIPFTNLSSVHELENAVNTVIRSCKDLEAIKRGLLSLGILIESNKETDKLTSEFITTINEKDIFVYVNYAAYVQHPKIFEGIKNLIILDPDTTTENCVYTSLSRWKPPCALLTRETIMLNPKKLLTSLPTHIYNDIYTPISILTRFNSMNNRIGVHRISEGVHSDIILVSFRDPPYGPIPMEDSTILNALNNAFYNVKLVLVDGEIVVDNFLHLNVGEEKIRRVHTIMEEFEKK